MIRSIQFGFIAFDLVSVGAGLMFFGVVAFAASVVPALGALRIDPASGRVHVRRNSGFEEFDERLERLPVALSSAEWYSGKLQHLPMAWIQTWSRTTAGGPAG